MYLQKICLLCIAKFAFGKGEKYSMGKVRMGPQAKPKGSKLKPQHLSAVVSIIWVTSLVPLALFVFSVTFGWIVDKWYELALIFAILLVPGMIYIAIIRLARRSQGPGNPDS